ncbi:MAG TPA: PIN domain-containing protein [Anaerolineales bacterium]|nr:PIN domain-containing protein [Anaerolineales bacterium]
MPGLKSPANGGSGMRRVFVDANVLIAGAHSRSGASRAVLMLAEVGLFRLVVSRQVLDEVERNIRAKLPGAMVVFVEILALLELEIVDDPTRAEWEPLLEVIEEKDAPILAAAVSAKVDRFITLNTKDFSTDAAARSGLTIQTPSIFIEEIRRIVTASM